MKQKAKAFIGFILIALGISIVDNPGIIPLVAFAITLVGFMLLKEAEDAEKRRR